MWHLMLVQQLLQLLVIIVFVDMNLQRLCFYPKNEPPGCVGLQEQDEGRKNRCLQLTN